jgi:hypothetical protein
VNFTFVELNFKYVYNSNLKLQYVYLLKFSFYVAPRVVLYTMVKSTALSRGQLQLLRWAAEVNKLDLTINLKYA